MSINNVTISDDFNFDNFAVDTFIHGAFSNLKARYDYVQTGLRVSYLTAGIFQKLEIYKDIMNSLRQSFKIPTLMTIGLSLASAFNLFISLHETIKDHDYTNSAHTGFYLFFSLTDILADFNSFTSSLCYFVNAPTHAILSSIILPMTLLCCIINMILKIKGIFNIHHLLRSESSITCFQTMKDAKLKQEVKKLLERHHGITKKEQEEINQSPNSTNRAQKYSVVLRKKEKDFSRLTSKTGQAQLKQLNELMHKRWVSGEKVRKVLSNLHKISHREIHSEIKKIAFTALIIVGLVFMALNVYFIPAYILLISAAVIRLVNITQNKYFEKKQIEEIS